MVNSGPILGDKKCVKRVSKIKKFVILSNPTWQITGFIWIYQCI